MPGGLYPPPSVIESWPKPNYINPVTQGPALTYLCIVVSSVSLASVTARAYARIFITRAPGIDDVLILIALGFSIALSVLIVLQQHTWDTGHHIWDLPISKFSGLRKNVYICEWCYLTATCAVKISILLFYRRLSVTFSKTFLIATWIGIIYNVLYWTTFVICLLAFFRPLNSYWLSFDPTWELTHKYSHANERFSLPLSAALSVVGDLYATLLPITLIRFLNLPSRQKAALYALFGLGFLVVAAGIVRTVLLDRVVSKSYDITWVLWENWIWTVVELNVAILAACAPALKPFFARYLVNPLASSGRRDSYLYDAQRRASAGQGITGQGRAAQCFDWSKNTNTARDSNAPIDMEKIGIALTAPPSKSEMIEDQIDDGVSMRHYELRTSQDGKMSAVQVHEQRSFDARSLHTATSSDAILPHIKVVPFDASPERKARHHNEGVALVPTPQQRQQYQPTDLGFSQPQPQVRPHTADNGVRDLQRSSGLISSEPSGNLKPGPGSVAAARNRAQQWQRLQDFGPQATAYTQPHTHTRSLSRGSERNFSLPSTTVVGISPYQHLSPEWEGDGGVSSEDTLGLAGEENSTGTKRDSVGCAV